LSSFFNKFGPTPPPSNPVEDILRGLKESVEQNMSLAVTPFSRILILQLSREHIVALKDGLTELESWLNDCINTERLI
jgi:hypothetical protein